MTASTAGPVLEDRELDSVLSAAKESVEVSLGRAALRDVLDSSQMPENS